MDKFIIFITANSIVTAAYFIWNFLRKKEKLLGYGVKSLIMFLCPGLGPLYVFFAYVIYLG